MDEEYENFLDHIRYWKPSQQLLDKVQQDKAICASSESAEEAIPKLLIENPQATVLTVSKQAAASVNLSVITTLFTTSLFTTSDNTI